MNDVLGRMTLEDIFVSQYQQTMKDKEALTDEVKDLKDQVDELNQKLVSTEHNTTEDFGGFVKVSNVAIETCWVEVQSRYMMQECEISVEMIDEALGDEEKLKKLATSSLKEKYGRTTPVKMHRHIYPYQIAALGRIYCVDFANESIVSIDLVPDDKEVSTGNSAVFPLKREKELFDAAMLEFRETLEKLRKEKEEE